MPFKKPEMIGDASNLDQEATLDYIAKERKIINTILENREDL